MSTVRLREITVSLESGSRPKGGVNADGDIPSLGGEHLDDAGGFRFDSPKRIDRNFFVSMKSGKISENDILIVKDGATTGKVSFINSEFPYREAAVNEHVFRLAVDEKRALPKFVFHYLFSARGQKAILSDFRGATVGGIGRTFLDRVEISLPPLDEQRRIATILDLADALRRKRHQTLQTFQRLGQSIFSQMFNRPDIARKPLHELIEVEAGLVDPTDKEYEDLPHIGPESIARDTGELLSYQTAKEDGVTSGKFLFDPDSIIFSKIRPYLNKVALAPSRGLCSADAYALKAKQGKATRYYIWFLLRQPDFLKYAETQSNRANIPKLNREQLLLYQAPAPNMELQARFEKRLKVIQENERKSKRSLEVLEMLFATLQREAFSGASRSNVNLAQQAAE